MSKVEVQPGIVTLLNGRARLLDSDSIGLVTNQSAVNPSLVHTLDLLLDAGANVKALFSPEHGIRGDTVEGEKVLSTVDSVTGLPVHSLYGNTRRPSPDILANLDTLIFDIQDVGARFYTYTSTLAHCMQACGAAGNRFVVLDRPNPLGGRLIEGPVLNAEFASFVGLYSIPIRYGLTIGELALMICRVFGVDVDLQVIPLTGWQRNMFFEDTGLPWVAPSPNMLSPKTAELYPGTCLMEGTNVSEGRGTDQPFEMIGAPWIDGTALAAKLADAQLPGVEFLPAAFVPSRSKYSGDLCFGAKLNVLDRQTFRPVLTGLKIIEIIRRLHPANFVFDPPGDDGRFFFDLLAGSDELRISIENGIPAEVIAEGWHTQQREFLLEQGRCLLYG